MAKTPRDYKFVWRMCYSRLSTLYFDDKGILNMNTEASGAISPTKKRVVRRLYVGVGILLLLTLVLGWYALFGPSARDAHEFLHHMPVDRIVEVQLQITWPTKQQVVRITDRKQIAELATAFRVATETSAGHRDKRWMVYIRFVTAQRDYGGEVSLHGEGVSEFCYWSSVDGGLCYGYYRNDNFVPLIRRILSTPALPQSDVILEVPPPP